MATLAVAVLVAGPAAAAETHVAVAANFAAPAEEIAAAFSAATGHKALLSFGATGSLYAQIGQGAPFEVFLAADNKRPAQSVADGLGVEGTAFTYAIGALALYGPGLDLTDGPAVLAAGAHRHLAIADPATAPYGAAAIEVLDELGLRQAVTPKLVTGENIAQVLQFVQSGNAELGFVAMSQVVSLKRGQLSPEPPNWGRDAWAVPAELHAPIRQDAVLLVAGAASPAAVSFLSFLRGDVAREIILDHGYALDEP